MAASERTYTIPLRKGVMKTKKYKRAKKAVSIIREFITRNSKSSDVRIGRHLNLKLWEHGIRNVPGSVKVDAVKDDKGTVTVELFGVPKEVKKGKGKKEAATAAAAVKKEEIKETVEAEKESVVAAETATAAKVTVSNQKKPAEQQ